MKAMLGTPFDYKKITCPVRMGTAQWAGVGRDSRAIWQQSYLGVLQSVLWRLQGSERLRHIEKKNLYINELMKKTSLYTFYIYLAFFIYQIHEKENRKENKKLWGPMQIPKHIYRSFYK